jgi:hypothetical protein
VNARIVGAYGLVERGWPSIRTGKSTGGDQSRELCQGFLVQWRAVFLQADRTAAWT